MGMTNLLSKNGEVLFFSNFFNEAESTELFNSLLTTIKWEQRPIKIFGKEVMQPRLTAWYGDEGKEYTYSGLTMCANSWIDPLLNIKNKIEKAAGVTFNSVLLNQYRNEQDSVGWHRDNEKELGKNPVIGSVSLGATRKFHLKHYFDKKLKTSIDLTHGSFLLMRGETQHFWQHSIPKKSTPTGARINLTFRVL